MGWDDLAGMFGTGYPGVPPGHVAAHVHHHVFTGGEVLRSIDSCRVPRCLKSAFADRPFCMLHWIPLPWLLKDGIAVHAQSVALAVPGAETQLDLACRAAVDYLKLNRSNLMPS